MKRRSFFQRLTALFGAAAIAPLVSQNIITITTDSPPVLTVPPGYAGTFYCLGADGIMKKYTYAGTDGITLTGVRPAQS